jgi:uncharacterized membrane protein
MTVRHITMNNSNQLIHRRKTLARAMNQTQAEEHIVQSIKAKMDARRTLAEKMADWLTTRFGSTSFLIFNLVWFSVWIVLNVGIIPGIQPFDPFPFGFLTMVVSLEAIVLAIVVLISQNREAQVAALREEVDVYINFRTEQELTKLLKMVSLLLEKHGIATSTDVELQSMLKKEDADQIEEELEEELETK